DRWRSAPGTARRCKPSLASPGLTSRPGCTMARWRGRVSWRAFPRRGSEWGATWWRSGRRTPTVDGACPVRRFPWTWCPMRLHHHPPDELEIHSLAADLAAAAATCSLSHRLAVPQRDPGRGAGGAVGADRVARLDARS